MAIPKTKNGRNMYDMLSLLQKAVRRGRYRDAAYAANELEQLFRKVAWSRILVISAEDCYGVLTKELIRLKEDDDFEKDNDNLGKAIAVMCKALKSRDACYFACNFILDNRNPRQIVVKPEEIKDYEDDYDVFGTKQEKLLYDGEVTVSEEIAIMVKAIEHRDMDMIGFQMNKLRFEYRNKLWDAFYDYAKEKARSNIADEIYALRQADEFVNRNRKEGMKDEIFISKAAMILLYDGDDSIGDVRSSEVVSLDELIDWSKYQIKKIEDCQLKDNKVPEWVFDCHTIKGKIMGKTDWDMTVDEQEALYPKKMAYFDEASWLYTYAQDLRNGVIDEEGFEPIRIFAETHEANPVKFIPYEKGELKDE